MLTVELQDSGFRAWDLEFGAINPGFVYQGCRAESCRAQDFRACRRGL